MSMLRLAAALSLWAAIPTGARAGAPVTLTPEQTRAIAARLSVERFDVVRVDLPSAADRSIDVVVETPGGPLALALERRSVRAEGFRLLLRGPNGALTEAPSAPVSTYRGEAFLAGDSHLAGAKAAASFSERGLDALVLGAGGVGGPALAIQPLTSVLPGADRAIHVIYRPHDVTARVPCAAPEGGSIGAADDGIAAATSGLKLCEIALEGDVAYVDAMGGAIPAQADAESILNATALIYETYVGITYELSTLILQAGPIDNYPATDPDALLSQFRDFWNSHHVGVQRDVAHLLTSRAIDGSIAGLAALGVVCKVSKAYGWSLTTAVVTFSLRVAITAHELGHNWNAPHCDGDPDCAVMCSVIQQCSGNVDRFETGSAKKIKKFRDGANCLTTVTAPLVPPVLVTFDSLKPTTFETIAGPKASTSAVGEPSSSKSAELDAKKNGSDDLLVSQSIDLSAVTGATLSFDVEHRGVEAGEELFVEFEDAGQNWIELFHLVSDGARQNTFAHRSIQLPMEALHENFHVRFRPAVGDAGDNWFVDDVRVFESTPPATALLCAADLPPLYATHDANQVGGPPDIIVTPANCGSSAATLVFTVAEFPAVPFFSVSSDATTFTVHFETSGLQPGLYFGQIKVQNDDVPGDFLVLPVTLIVHSGPWFAPGARLEGTIDPGGETDVASFIALGGTNLKIGVKTTVGNLAPIVDVLTLADNLVFSQRFSSTAKSKKITIPIPFNGIFKFRITPGNQSSGAYQITTKAKMVSGGRLHDDVLRPLVNGAPLQVSMLALPGALLNVTVVPLDAGDGPFGIASYVDPTNADVASAAFTRQLPTGGVQVAGITAGKIGAYTLTIDGFVAREKVRVTLDPVQAVGPKGTIVVP